MKCPWAQLSAIQIWSIYFLIACHSILWTLQNSLLHYQHSRGFLPCSTQAPLTHCVADILMHVLQPSQRVNGSEDNHFPWGQQRPASKLNKAARKGDSKSILGQDVKKVVGESKIKYLITKQTHPVDLSKVMMIKNCKKATASGSDKLHSLQIKCNQLSPCTPGLLTSLSCSRCRCSGGWGSWLRGHLLSQQVRSEKSGPTLGHPSIEFTIWNKTHKGKTCDAI